MKYIIALLLSINIAHSQTIVITPFNVGTVVDQICRKIFETYDKTYGTKHVVQNITGADHMLAHKHFLQTDNSLLCAGNGVAGSNQKYHPNVSPGIETLQPIIGVMSFTQFIFTGENNFNSIDELFKKQRISIGAPSQNGAKALTVILDKNKIKYDLIVYRKPTDSLISLKENTLDVYVDGGTLYPTLVANNFKELAHFSMYNNKSKSVNLTKKYPEINHLTSTVIIFTKPNDKETTQLNKKLNTVINSTEVQEFFKERLPYHTVINGSVESIEKELKLFRESLNNVHN